MSVCEQDSFTGVSVSLSHSVQKSSAFYLRRVYVQCTLSLLKFTIIVPRTNERTRENGERVCLLYDVCVCARVCIYGDLCIYDSGARWILIRSLNNNLFVTPPIYKLNDSFSALLVGCFWLACFAAVCVRIALFNCISFDDSFFFFFRREYETHLLHQLSRAHTLRELHITPNMHCAYTIVRTAYVALWNELLLCVCAGS